MCVRNLVGLTEIVHRANPAYGAVFIKAANHMPWFVRNQPLTVYPWVPAVVKTQPKATMSVPADFVTDWSVLGHVRAPARIVAT